MYPLWLCQKMCRKSTKDVMLNHCVPHKTGRNFGVGASLSDKPIGPHSNHRNLGPGFVGNSIVFVSKDREVLRFPANLLIRFWDRIILVLIQQNCDDKNLGTKKCPVTSSFLLRFPSVFGFQPWRMSISRSSSALRGGPL